MLSCWDREKEHDILKSACTRLHAVWKLHKFSLQSFVFIGTDTLHPELLLAMPETSAPIIHKDFFFLMLPLAEEIIKHYHFHGGAGI